jgi:phosphoglycolate phosphatase
MKSYQYLFFDLDGTLTDPGEGITNSVAYALDKFGITVTDRASLYPFIGPPLVDSFMKFYGFSHEDAERAVVCYREYFRDRGIFENRLYEGIPEALKALKDAGKTLVIATSKPEPFAKRIVEHFGLSPYFTLVAGASFDETRSEKWDVIEYAMDSLKLTDRSEIVMIGDRKHDIIGAKKTGLDSVGVLWGYGDREELTSAGAEIIFDTVGQLTSLGK